MHTSISTTILGGPNTESIDDGLDNAQRQENHFGTLNIKPHYSINDEVWVIDDEKQVVRTRVKSVCIKYIGRYNYDPYTSLSVVHYNYFYFRLRETYPSHYKITYDLCNDMKNVNQDSLFISKEELITNL